MEGGGRKKDGRERREKEKREWAHMSINTVMCG